MKNRNKKNSTPPQIKNQNRPIMAKAKAKKAAPEKTTVEQWVTKVQGYKKGALRNTLQVAYNKFLELNPDQVQLNAMHDALDKLTHGKEFERQGAGKVAAEVKDVAKKAERVAKEALQLAADAAEVVEEAEEAQAAVDPNVRQVAAGAPEAPRRKKRASNAAGETEVVKVKKSKRRPAAAAAAAAPEGNESETDEEDNAPAAAPRKNSKAKKSKFKLENTEIVERKFGKVTRSVIKKSGVNVNGEPWARYYSMDKGGGPKNLLGREKHVIYSKKNAAIDPKSGFDLTVADWMDIANRRFNKTNGVYKRQVPIPRYKKPTDVGELISQGYSKRKFKYETISRLAEGHEWVEVNVTDLPVTDLYSRPPIAKDAQSRYQYMINWFAIPDKAKDTTDYNAHKRAVANLEERIMTYIMTDDRVGRSHFNFDASFDSITSIQLAARSIFQTDCRRAPVSLKRRGKRSIPENLILGFQIWKRLKGIRKKPKGKQLVVRKKYAIPPKFLANGEPNPANAAWKEEMKGLRQRARQMFKYNDPKTHRFLVNSLAMYMRANKDASREQIQERHNQLVADMNARKEDSKSRRIELEKTKDDIREAKTAQRRLKESMVNSYYARVQTLNPGAIANPFQSQKIEKSWEVQQAEAKATRAENHEKKLKAERDQLRDQIHVANASMRGLYAKLGQKGIHNATKERHRLVIRRLESEIEHAQEGLDNVNRRIEGKPDTEAENRKAVAAREERLKVTRAKGFSISKTRPKGVSVRQNRETKEIAKVLSKNAGTKTVRKVKKSSRGKGKAKPVDTLGEYSMNFY